MGRLTRSASGKTAAACNCPQLAVPPQSASTIQPAKRTSRRLANSSNNASSIESPSSTSEQVKTDALNTAAAKSMRMKGRASQNKAIKNGTEEVSNGECLKKENNPSAPQDTHNRVNNSSSASKNTNITSAQDKEATKKEEGSEPRLILATQADARLPIDADCGSNHAATVTTNRLNLGASHQKEQEQAQQGDTTEHTGEPLAVAQWRRKWSRPTKVVKLEEELSAVSMPDSGKADEEDVDGEEADEEGTNTSSSSEDSDGEYGRSSKRTKIEKSVPRFKSQASTELSEYEKQRLENIRRNQEMLMSLELPTAVTQLQIATLEGTPVQENGASAEGFSINTPAPVRISKQRVWKGAPKIVQPIRVSNRIRGLVITPAMIGENDKPEQGSQSHKDAKNQSAESGNFNDNTQSDREGEGDEDMANLMSGDLFFDKATRERAIRVDGHYHGWLDPGVIERYGFEKSAKDAWEANGGGSFSFKDPLGAQIDAVGTARSRTAKRPKHEAKMVAKGLFKKNPNAFFYRHNEPGQEQWTGDWTTEEQEIFLKVAAEHGCGDKWGLFASHIPHRVGYQCSNFYRQVVLPEGMVFDPNYEYTSRGKPIYCGKHNQWRK
ncbi:hypothetical protein EC991_008309 [Linnemannia zychae]|nr:hypothetical protein EC991_008309 [Linnemannia zychae]